MPLDMRKDKLTQGLFFVYFLLTSIFHASKPQSSKRTSWRTIMDTPIAVTIPDAVRLSGCSRSALYEALKRGDLTARKAGRRTLIIFSDLEAYLASLPTYRAGA
jgi:excisionase family DNA binding protein